MLKYRHSSVLPPIHPATYLFAIEMGLIVRNTMQPSMLSIFKTTTNTMLLGKKKLSINLTVSLYPSFLTPKIITPTNKILMRAAKQCWAVMYNFNFSPAMNSHGEELSFLCRCQREKPKQLNITQKK